jgi:oligopeptide transport system substrate-binding protein
MGRICKFLSLVFVLSFLFYGCQSKSEKPDFTFINGPEPQTLDPALVTGQLEARLCAALFEGLTRRAADGSIQPGVAMRWECSHDGLVYTFYLRQNACWSDGTPLTAGDFIYAWHRVLTPETGSKYAEILFFIKNAENYFRGKLKDFNKVGVHALDSHTLQITLRDPTPFFPDLTAFTTYLPVPRQAIERYGDAWTKPEKMISNGAYVLVNWKINDHVSFRKNKKYWNADRVVFKCVDALTVTEATTAFNMYATGLADLIMDKGLIPVELIQELKKRPDFHSHPVLGTYFYRFNVTRKPFDSRLVRQAFAMAIDKERLVEKITKAGEKTADSLVPPGIPGYQPPEGLSYDPKKAKYLLTEAGYPDGRGFPMISLLYNKSELNEQIATEIQAMWQKVLNVHVELKNQEWATYLNSMDHLDFDIVRSSWIGDYDNPNTFLDCFVTGRGNNRTGWSDATYDDLLSAANRETDLSKRFNLLQKAERILITDEMPIVPLYYYSSIQLYNSKMLGGIVPNVMDMYPIQDMYWIK